MVMDAYQKKRKMMAGEDTERMSLSQISEYLHLPEQAVTRLADTQGMPADKDAKEWMFEKAAVDNWVTARIQSASNESLINILTTKKQLIPLPRLVSLDHIVLDMEPASKEEMLSQLVAPLVETGVIRNATAFLQQLLEREGMLSTALCDGVAIPHVRDHKDTGIKEPCIVLGICGRGVDFGSLDGRSTTLFFLPCSPDTSTHLRLLAKLTFMMRLKDMPGRLSRCRTRREVMDHLIAAHLQMSIEM